MENMLKNKWVLLGGAAVVGIGIFMFARGGGSSSDNTDSGTTYPPFLYAGMGAGGYGTGQQVDQTADSGSGATGSLVDYTSQLLGIQNKKADYDYQLGLKSVENEKYALDVQKDVSFKQMDTDVSIAALGFYGGVLGNKKNPLTKAVAGGGSLTLDRTPSGGFSLSNKRPGQS